MSRGARASAARTIRSGFWQLVVDRAATLARLEVQGRAGARAGRPLRWIQPGVPGDRDAPAPRRRSSPEGDRPERRVDDRRAADAATVGGQGRARHRARWSILRAWEGTG